MDQNLSASQRKEKTSTLIEQLPRSNQQVLSCVLRHLKHVIENKHVNKMSEEVIARSIGPSLIGYKNAKPTPKDYQTAHHYQRSVTLCLLQLRNVGPDCVLGRALKQLENAQKSYPGPNKEVTSTPSRFKLFGK